MSNMAGAYSLADGCFLDDLFSHVRLRAGVVMSLARMEEIMCLYEQPC